MRILIFIILSYCSANVYFYFKLTDQAGSGTLINMLIGAAVFFLSLSPVLIPIYTHRGSMRSITIFSYIGYMWLAFLVPFFSIGIILDAYNLALQQLSPYVHYDLLSKAIPGSIVFYAPLFLSLLINVYGLFEAQNLRVERLVIPTPKLPAGAGKVRIAQISDLHLGVMVRDRIVDRVITLINDENPDIIVSTGDLVDGITKHIGHLSAKLKNLQPRLGKYAVTGNHEVYGGTKRTKRFIEEAGFEVLRGRGITAGSINIAGMDFSGGEISGYKKDGPQTKESDVLSGLPDGLFTLLLKHRSDVEKDSIGRFDLQLSGHTHSGQIFPMHLAVMFLFQHHTGFTKLPEGSAIYVSRGAGTAGPPVRFLSTPEITIIDIVPS